MPERLMHELAATDRMTLGGPLTVRNAKPIRARMIEAIRQYPMVTIDCAGATEVDLSFIQLVLAARKSAAAAGKSFSLARPAAGVLLQGLLQAGLVGPADGQPVADQNFWLN